MIQDIIRSAPDGGIRRRILLRGAGVAVAGIAAAGLAACTGIPPRDASSSTGTTVTPSDRPSRVLLAYFSRPGENYWDGGRRNLATGNTEVLAGLVRERIDCDVFRIAAADPYADRYEPTVARNVREQNADARPKIADSVPDLSGYDTVLLGSPIWNVQPPMIMATFVDAVDLTRATVRPFVTYAVSGLGNTRAFYRGLNTGGRLGDGLAIRGEQVRDPSAGSDVDRWLHATDLA